MKKTLVTMMCIVFAATIFVGCGGPTPEAKATFGLEVATKLVYHLRYIKDPRTGACFAYYGYPGNYSSVMATVPCETVPSHLLITPKVN